MAGFLLDLLDLTPFCKKEKASGEGLLPSILPDYRQRAKGFCSGKRLPSLWFLPGDRLIKKRLKFLG